MLTSEHTHAEAIAQHVKHAHQALLRVVVDAAGVCAIYQAAPTCAHACKLTDLPTDQPTDPCLCAGACACPPPPTCCAEERNEQPADGAETKVWGNLVAYVERLDDELFKSLQVNTP